MKFVVHEVDQPLTVGEMKIHPDDKPELRLQKPTRVRLGTLLHRCSCQITKGPVRRSFEVYGNTLR